jgi:hypothetical protein
VKIRAQSKAVCRSNKEIIKREEEGEEEGETMKYTEPFIRA